MKDAIIIIIIAIIILCLNKTLFCICAKNLKNEEHLKMHTEEMILHSFMEKV
jgi:hypothetical protein